MITVAFLPINRNPYQHLLMKALGRKGIHTISLSAMPTAAWLIEHRHDVQILHLHWLDALYLRRYLTPFRLSSFVVRLWLADRLGYGLVWTVHNLRSHRLLLPRIDSLIRRLVAKWADAVITHCNYARQRSLELFPRQGPTFVIPHGNYADAYPISMDQDSSRTYLDIEHDAFVYLLLGNISPYKGVDKFLDIFREQARLDEVAVIAGRDFAPRLVLELEDYAKHDRRIRVFPRYIEDNEVQKFVLAADVMVFCFNEILTSGSVILGLTHGLPVVAPAMGCLPELITEEAGILYNPLDTASLAQALRAIRERDLSAMGSAALQIANQLGWEAIAEQTAAVYYQCLGTQS